MFVSNVMSAKAGWANASGHRSNRFGYAHPIPITHANGSKKHGYCGSVVAYFGFFLVVTFMIALVKGLKHNWLWLLPIISVLPPFCGLLYIMIHKEKKKIVKSSKDRIGNSTGDSNPENENNSNSEGGQNSDGDNRIQISETNFSTVNETSQVTPSIYVEENSERSQDMDRISISPSVGSSLPPSYDEVTKLPNTNLCAIDMSLPPSYSQAQLNS